MNADIEGLYQDIGREAYAIAPDLNGKLLVYAEAEDGVISGSLFYEKGPGKVATFKFCPEILRDLIYSLWEKWSTHPGNAEWRAMAYLVQDGKFSIDLTYPEQMNPDEDLPERRQRVIEKYFGNTSFDYSNP
jgi:hypothetical protein